MENNTKEIVATATQKETKKETSKKETKKVAKKETPKAEPKKETKTGKTSIYKSSLFLKEDGTPMNPTEKKSKRKSLRRERDNFIARFLQCQKDSKKLKELQKAWAEYAKGVYMDLTNIFESNTTLENQSSIQNFLKAMTPKVATAKA
jgi:uncharacterized protein YegL